MLTRLAQFNAEINAAYESFGFHKAYQAVAMFSSIDLSSFYFSIIKDRLYSAASKSEARKSAQTVLFHVR